MNAWLQALIALGGFAGLGSFFTIGIQRKKLLSESRLSEADAAARVSDTALKLLAPAQEQLERLQRQLREANERSERLASDLLQARADAADLRCELDSARNEIHALRARLAGGL